MGWFSRRRPVADGIPTKLDREATPDDLAALEEFVRSRRGVEFYLEPETTATDTTVMAIAHDGEWIRRRTGSPRAAAKIAQRHAVPLYEAARTGYPERMRAWNRAHPERRAR
ncbi:MULTISPECIES: hypothetical protein [Micromonospora]|uniref:Uncharacterized protein n=1 Tax=Micromonospora carbonacea TaxID=47853 RepID=A0A7H8XN77_9ACTN|nr:MULTISPECIES: hypothetical protein [Micromonospora]MBB5826884.1 hypothetical protein [Micromonospora carbonacea]QLD25272.1 hypothetical protein HXZ27_14505 [Micromonospora carbonacea]WFE55646.1 hypothetical protein O7633_01675 [Micromonospora sp. WMMD712]